MKLRRVYQIVRKQSYDFLRARLSESIADSKLMELDNIFKVHECLEKKYEFDNTRITKLLFVKNQRYAHDPWLQPILDAHKQIEKKELPIPTETTSIQKFLLILKLIVETPKVAYIVYRLLPNYHLFILCLSTIYKYQKENYFYLKYNFDQACVLLTNSYNHFGLVSAVKNSKGQVIDVQHSVIYKSHKGYDYQRWVDASLEPTGIYLYSRLWQQQIKSQSMVFFEYNSSRVSKKSRAFVYNKDEIQAGRIIIFSQKTKNKIVRELVGQLDPDYKKKVFIKLHPKEIPEEYEGIAPILTSSYIYGADRLFAFNSSVIIDLHDQGAFCNVYAENSAEFSFLDNIRPSGKLNDLLPANTDWRQNKGVPVFAKTTDSIIGGRDDF